MDMLPDRPYELARPPDPPQNFADPPLARGEGRAPTFADDANPFSTEFTRPRPAAGAMLSAAGLGPAAERGNDSNGAATESDVTATHPAGGTPTGPPPGEPPPDLAPEPEDPAEWASRAFDAIPHNPPSEEMIARAEAADASISWLGLTEGRSPIATTFGAEDEITLETRRHERGVPDAEEGLPPQLAPAIVARQLADFGTTLTRVIEAEAATNELAELAAEHAGHTIRLENPILESTSGMTSLDVAGFFVTADPIGTGVSVEAPDWGPLEVEEAPSGPLDFKPPYILQTADGAFEIIEPDLSGRVRASSQDGMLVVTNEEAHWVEEGDAAYFRDLHADFAEYKGLLLEVAGEAGFSREAIIDPATGQPNTAYLLGQVAPAVADPAFQSRLSPALRTNLTVACEVMADAINTSDIGRGLLARTMRVGAYFDAAISSTDTQDGR